MLHTTDIMYITTPVQQLTVNFALFTLFLSMYFKYFIYLIAIMLITIYLNKC